MLRHIEDRVVGEMTDHERTVLRHAAVWFFLVLCGYYILRPIREQISSTYGIKNLAWLFKATFMTMLVAIPLYAYLVSRFHRRKLVPTIYAFFVATLGGFWAVMQFVPAKTILGDWTGSFQKSIADIGWLEWLSAALQDGASTTIQEWVARILFIWISVYGLFVVSFFWSVIGDMFTPDQGRRLFGFVAGGGTAGGLIASLVVSFMVKTVGPANLLLVPATLLVFSLAVYFSLERVHSRAQAKSSGPVTGRSGRATGGNPFAGLTAIFSSKYLMAICIYGLLLATCGTTIYFQQSEIVNTAFDVSEQVAALESIDPPLAMDELDRQVAALNTGAKAAKTSFFAQVNFWVQILTLVLQTAVVGRMMKTFGLGFTLTILPAAYILGITSLAIAPTIAVLAIISVTGRSAEYAIANPAREVLFTAVKREDRYKAKSFIDTIVRRGGDTMVGDLYGWLRESQGFAMTTLSWCVVPIAVCWVGLGLFIGGENKKVVARIAEETPADSES